MSALQTMLMTVELKLASGRRKEEREEGGGKEMGSSFAGPLSLSRYETVLLSRQGCQLACFRHSKKSHLGQPILIYLFIVWHTV